MIKTRFNHIGYPFDNDGTTPISPSSSSNHVVADKRSDFLRSTTKASSNPQATSVTNHDTTPESSPNNFITAVTASSNTNDSYITFITNATNNYINNSLLLWNAGGANDSLNFTLDSTADFMGTGGSNITLSDMPPSATTWSSCLEWSAAQHNLFQIANLLFAAAFCCPPSFKQSVLVVR